MKRKTKHNPAVISNDYFVTGTVERKAWREGLQNPKLIGEMLEYAADFKKAVKFEVQPTGWYQEE